MSTYTVSTTKGTFTYNAETLPDAMGMHNRQRPELSREVISWNDGVITFQMHDSKIMGTDLEREAQEIGRNHGYNHANYVDAYGGDMDEKPSVPLRFAEVETYYTAAYAEGVEQYRNDAYPDESV